MTSQKIIAASLASLFVLSLARASAAQGTCGNGYCDAWAGETGQSCPRDCYTQMEGPPWHLPTWLHVGASFQSAAVFAEGQDETIPVNDRFAGMAVGLSLRVEASFTPWLSLLYQNAFLGGYARRNHPYGGFGDCNTLLLSVRAWEHLELGVGPSGDVIAISVTEGKSFGVEAGVGLHGRVAYRFKPHGLVLSADVHRSFTYNPIVWVGPGLGADFF